MTPWAGNLKTDTIFNSLNLHLLLNTNAFIHKRQDVDFKMSGYDEASQA
jgi:hypothetical protein